MKNKKTLVAVIVLVAMIAVALFCWFALKPSATEGEKAITVEITHQNGAVNIYELETQAEYLYDALWEEALIGELENGFFTELDGETADGENEEWWGYTRSGEYVNYGVADCVIVDGDHYEFTLHVGWE